MWGERTIRAVWWYRARWSLDAVEAADALEARVLQPVEQAEPAAEPVGGDLRAAVFSGGFSGFWTTNGSMAAPRKPAPMVGAADADDVRQVELALAQLAGHGAAEVGCLTVADGT